jgi:multidrug efflux pump subunit AcrA (membrane-fusion protein)
VKPKEEEKPPPHVVEWKGVTTVILREWTELLGTVQPLPQNLVRVSAPVEGVVVTVLPGDLTEGQQVKEGTVLVQLYSKIAQANSEKAKALKEAAEQDEKQARTAITLAEKKWAAIKDVPNVPELQKEEARLGVEDANSKLIAAVKRLQAADNDAKAAADQMKLYSLTTPITGRLDRILVARGQTIPVGTVVAEVADVEKEVDVLCFVSRNVAQRLATAQTAPLGEARLGGITETPAEKQRTGPKGKIALISDRADPDTGNFAVKVRFPNDGSPEDKLRPNTSLRLRVLTDASNARSSPEPVLSIPESALLEDTDPPSVIIVEDVEVIKDDEGKKKETRGKARRLQATIGLRDRIGGMVEIKDLKDPENKWKGDLKDVLFVTNKNQGLQTGDILKLDEEEEGK